VAKTRKAAKSESKPKSARSNGGWAAIKKRLLEHRKEILDLYEHDLRVGQAAADETTDDIVDRANNSYNREFMFSLSGAERQTLLSIDEALIRLDKGTYGSCVHCSEPIGTPRLKAVPWAGLCIGCQEALEQGMLEEISE
jgi:DnaK suppressor protein